MIGISICAKGESQNSHFWGASIRSILLADMFLIGRLGRYHRRHRRNRRRNKTWVCAVPSENGIAVAAPLTTFEPG